MRRRTCCPKRIKAGVYRWLSDPGNNRKPADLVILEKIRQFGTEAINGKAELTDSEISRFEYLAGIVNAYNERAKGDWNTYRNNNPYWARQLFEAAELAK